MSVIFCFKKGHKRPYCYADKKALKKLAFDDSESDSRSAKDSLNNESTESKVKTDEVWKEKNRLSCSMIVVSTSSNHASTMINDDWTDLTQTMTAILLKQYLGNYIHVIPKVLF